MPDGDWLEKESFADCTDQDERVVMRIERTRKVKLNSGDLT